MSYIKNNYLNLIMLMPLYWTFTGMFLYPNGKKLIVVLTLLAAIVSIYSYRLQNIKDNIKKNPLLWLLGLSSLFALCAKYYYGYSSSQLRAFITLFVYFLILPQSLIAKIDLKLMTILGAASALIFTFLQVFIFDNARMWDINPIPYATFIASISILTLYFLLQRNTLKRSLIWFFVVLCTLVCLLYSQSRGVWLALLSVGILLVVKSSASLKRFVFLLIPICALLATSFYFSSENVSQRIQNTRSEIQQIESGNLNTSIGMRLQMWKAALMLIEEYPLLGLGDNHKKYKEELAAQGLISQEIIEFTHYHNQFINEQIKYGIVGLSLLLISLLLPLYYFYKNSSPYAWPGFLVMLLFFVASLTDVPFQHAQTLTFYFIVMYITLCAPSITQNNLLHEKTAT